MCDLCCTLIAVSGHLIGEILICARCYERYDRLRHKAVGGNDGRRLYIVEQVHTSRCDDCERSRSLWVDRNGMPYVAQASELAAAYAW